MRKLIKALSFVFGVALLATGQAQAAATVTYYHHDALGSVIASSHEDGYVNWNEEYQPYGEKIYDTVDTEGGNDDFFTGKNFERDLDLTYFGARWYDAKQGRFLSMDPAGVSLTSIHSFNRYHYANNNPYRYIDPDGQIPVETVWDVANIALGVASFSSNISQGNYGSATVDALGIIVDSGATVLPYIPGGVGTVIKSSRAVDEIADASNYRSRFLKSRPDLPSGHQIHHSVPQQYQDIFQAGGVNIQETQFLRGVSPELHSKITKEWGRFHRGSGGDPTAAQVADFAKKIDEKYAGDFVFPGE